MGHIEHHAIVVTSFDHALLVEARNMADGLSMKPTDIVHSEVNGYESFMVPPDGSKSGWSESEAGDLRRSQLIAWMRSKSYVDGSSALEWCEVRYGSDDRTADVTQSQWSEP